MHACADVFPSCHVIDYCLHVMNHLHLTEMLPMAECTRLASSLKQIHRQKVDTQGNVMWSEMGSQHCAKHLLNEV